MKVNFSRPYSPFLAALATAYFGIESPASLKQGPDALARKIVGYFNLWSRTANIKFSLTRGTGQVRVTRIPGRGHKMLGIHSRM